MDFFAVYLIPADAWYIIPYGALGKRLTLHFVPGGQRQKYAKYREAWHLLEGKKEIIEIFACADPEWESGSGSPPESHPNTDGMGLTPRESFVLNAGE